MENKKAYSPKKGQKNGNRKNDEYRRGREERRPERRQTPPPPATGEEWEQEGIHGEHESGAVIGRNAVRELLKSERSIDKLLVAKGERTGSITVLVAQAIERGIPVIETEKQRVRDKYNYLEKKQLTNNTVIVIAALIIVGLIIFGLDTLFISLSKLILG